MASSTKHSSYGFAKRPGCKISTATYSSRTKTCYKQQHVDHKIANALLKKGTRDANKAWNQQDHAWVDMRLHESHDEGGFGVPNNTITRSAASCYDQRQVCCLPAHLCLPCSTGLAAGQRPQDPATWDGPPLCQLKRLHEDLLHLYHCTDQPAAAQPAPPSFAGGSAAANAGANPQPQHAGSQDSGNGKLVLTQFNRLQEALKRSQVSLPASSSSQDQQPTIPSPIPSQRRLTQQLTKQWPQFKPLRQHNAGTRPEEQRQLHLPQKHKATVPESTLRVVMNELEEQAENTKACDLFWKPLPWLGTLRPTTANDAYDRQRCLRHSALGDACLHDARFGGSRALLPPPPQ